MYATSRARGAPIVLYPRAMQEPQGEPEPRGTVDESTLEPVGRDRRFVVRLVLLLLVGLLAATFVGSKLQRAAGSCGADLVQPGSTVIPPTR